MSASIGSDEDSHSIRINSIPSTNDTGYQYAAECKCGWITVNVTARMTEARAVRHYTDHRD